jgi:hypothetical protein
MRALVLGWYARALRTVLSWRDRTRGFVQRHLPNESQHLFVLTVLVGIVCGFVAVFFHVAIRASESLLIDRALSG